LAGLRQKYSPREKARHRQEEKEKCRLSKLNVMMSSELNRDKKE